MVPVLGLTTEDAGRRADAWGANEPPEPVRRPQWLRLLDQVGSWLIGILLATAVIAGTVDEVKNALVITVVLLVNATIGYLRERRAERSLEALPAGLPAPLSAIRLLWVNIIMDGPPAMALAFDPPQDNVMQRPPRPPGERVLEARLWPPSRAPAPSWPPAPWHSSQEPATSVTSRPPPPWPSPRLSSSSSATLWSRATMGAPSWDATSCTTASWLR